MIEQLTEQQSEQRTDLGSEPPRAVVLLSGGLDSSTLIAIAKAKGTRITALSFRYGQQHAFELNAAKRVAEAAGVTDHLICTIDLGVFGGSALTDAQLEVPKGRDEAAMAAGIPITYVPARNTIFLSFALALAEVRRADAIYIGVNAIDYSGYPDCRPEYIAGFQAMADLATKAGVEGHGPKIVAPLLHLSKAEIITRGLALGVDYGMTHSCYAPDASGAACGSCDACALRLAGFEAAGLPDPARYQRS